jgi:hypothetical protein
LPLTLRKKPVSPLFHGALTVSVRPALHRLAPNGRLCVWTEEFRVEAEDEQELVNRLVRQGVIALVAAGPWSPRPRGTPAIWWEDTVAGRLVTPDHLLVPTLARIGGAQSATEWALLLHRLARGPATVVLTTRDEPSPFGGPTLLRESWGPSYHIDHILKRL